MHDRTGGQPAHAFERLEKLLHPVNEIPDKPFPNPLNLPPHQLRVVEEKHQLDDRLQKLGVFIKESSIYPTLDAAERERLVRQESCMAEYSAILAARITAFAA